MSVCFFFSSRRRHTRLQGDWSSDCALPIFGEAARRAAPGAVFEAPGPLRAGAHATGLVEGWRGPIWHWVLAAGGGTPARGKRSGERGGGEEGGSRGGAEPLKKKKEEEAKVC